MPPGTGIENLTLDELAGPLRNATDPSSLPVGIHSFKCTEGCGWEVSLVEVTQSNSTHNSLKDLIEKCYLRPPILVPQMV